MKEINKKALVTVLLCGAIVKNSYAYRISNRTLKLKNHLFPNSDGVMLEDKYGHKYTRVLPKNPEFTFTYFTII